MLSVESVSTRGIWFLVLGRIWILSQLQVAATWESFSYFTTSFWFHLHSIYLTSWFWLNLDHLPACTWQRMFWWNLECFSSTQLNSWTWDRTLLGVTFTQDYYFQQITNIILQKRCFLLKPDPACFGETGAAFLRLGWTPEHGTGVSLLLSPLHKISTSSKPPITFCISATKKMFPP